MILFKERFAELRKEKGFNQRELAKILNVTQPAICKWETGDREPDFTMLEKLCQVFDVSSDYLLGIESNNLNSEYEFNYQHENTKLIHKEKKV